MAAVWDAAGFTASEKLVLLGLADHANDQGECYPSVGRLVRKTALSRRTVQSVLKDLTARGFLRVGWQAGPRGANRYTVVLKRLSSEAGAGGAMVAPPAQPLHGGCKKRQKGVQPLHGGGAAAAPEPSINHKEPEGAHVKTRRMVAKEMGLPVVCDDCGLMHRGDCV